MSKLRLLIGAAGLSCLLSGVAANAQDASSPSRQEPAAAPQDCSGIHCLLSWHFDSEAPAGAQQIAPTSSAPAASDTATAQKTGRAAQVVTIAANAPEIPRLQRLAAALSKEKIKIVKTQGAGNQATSDFSVSAALEANGGSKQTKLFTEQLHIVAGGAVHTVGDLDGKVVSFGPEKSASQAAGRKAFEALNIHVQEAPLDIENALDGLASGDVDAVVLLAPQPIDRLKTVSAPGVHLVSWPEGGTLPNGATSSTIYAAAYPRLATSGEPIRAVGVNALLTISQKGAKAVAAKSFLKALSKNSDALAKRGFDLIKADLDSRAGRHVASADRVQ